MATRVHSTGRKALAVLLTLVPGLGHIVLDRHKLGILLFFIFAFSANGAFVVVKLWAHAGQRPVILLLSALGLASVYPYAFVSILRLTFARDEAAVEKARQVRMKEAVASYLQGHLEKAGEIFRGLYREDELDVDAIFYLGMIHKDAGERRRARRMFRRCVSLDRKWRWEVSQLLRELNGKA